MSGLETLVYTCSGCKSKMEVPVSIPTTCDKCGQITNVCQLASNSSKEDLRHTFIFIGGYFTGLVCSIIIAFRR